MSKWQDKYREDIGKVKTDKKGRSGGGKTKKVRGEMGRKKGGQSETEQLASNLG